MSDWGFHPSLAPPQTANAHLVPGVPSGESKSSSYASISFVPIPLLGASETWFPEGFSVGGILLNDALSPPFMFVVLLLAALLIIAYLVYLLWLRTQRVKKDPTETTTEQLVNQLERTVRGRVI